MEWSITHFIPLFVLTSSVALLYSSVGHGGASGYLAILSFYSVPHEQMAASALCLNLLVAGMAFRSFAQAEYFSWKLTYPFAITSIPAAFVGGLFKIPSVFYNFLLAGVLLYASIRLFLSNHLGQKQREVHAPYLLVSLSLGCVIGIFSGLIGIGGGIFLSPLLIFFGWAVPKRAASTSAFFILSNSIAAILGRAFRHRFEIDFSPLLILILVSAFAGGVLGSHLGAKRFSNQCLNRLLASVLFAAALKLCLLL